MTKILRILFALLVVSIIGARAHAGDPLRVGVYENPPLVFMDAEGQARGLAIDILTYVANQEDWQIEIVPCEWPRCLARLEAGDIDLLGAIAFSEERNQHFDFTTEALITNWGQVYTRPDAQIESLLDLDGKTLVVLRDDIHFPAIQELLQSFGISASFVEVDTYSAVFALLQDGGADAGVVNRLFANQFARDYDLHETAILFHPIEVRYAATKGEHEDVLAALDRHLNALKADEDSLYYHSLSHWFGGAGSPQIPPYLVWGGLIAAGLALVFLVISLVLRVRVLVKTRELRSEIAQRTQAEQALQTKTLQQQSLINAARHLTESLAVDDVLQRLGQQAKTILDARGCTIYLLEEDGETLTPVVAIGPDIEEQIPATTLQVHASLTGQAVLALRGLIFNQPSVQENVKHIPGTSMHQQERFLVAPLVIDDQVFGAMKLNRLGPIFEATDLALAETFAACASIALRNARLYERVIRDTDDMEKRVHKRTEELQAFVDLTTGRELRMAELKQVIKQLRTQLQDAGMTPVADDPLSGHRGS
ncbi:MAG: transporter substrate-binding domain-containing protein [Chloroflexi bacterium]|nr:transporter substrate-binding domain-containing protein [Chloroflexota bacterium]